MKKEKQPEYHPAKTGTPIDKFAIIESYVQDKSDVLGVPQHSISDLMTELGLDELKFYEFMNGQTCGYIDGEVIYYVDDIERFVNNLPCID